MTLSISGIGSSADFRITAGTQAASGTKPVFDASRIYNSLGDFSTALFRYEDQWAAEYSRMFSEMDNGGVMTADELKAFMQQEFAAFGVTYVDSNPKDVSTGKHLVYIDDVNLRKMAEDPEYRAKNFALMQRELISGVSDFRFRDAHGVVTSRIHSSVFSLSEENPSVGGSRYAGMGAAATHTDRTQAASGKGTKGKSVAESIAERIAELRERVREKKLKEKQEAQKKALEKVPESDPNEAAEEDAGVRFPVQEEADPEETGSASADMGRELDILA